MKNKTLKLYGNIYLDPRAPATLDNQQSIGGGEVKVSEPKLGEVVLLETAGTWAVCGPRFFALEGDKVRTIEHFSNGTSCYKLHSKADVRLSRPSGICEIA